MISFDLCTAVNRLHFGGPHALVCVIVLNAERKSYQPTHKELRLCRIHIRLTVARQVSLSFQLTGLGRRYEKSLRIFSELFVAPICISVQRGVKQVERVDIPAIERKVVYHCSGYQAKKSQRLSCWTRIRYTIE